MRAALYARYSDDLQRPASIADQLVLGARVAAQRGCTVVDQFTDAAISGFATANRPGLLAMMAAAERGAFDVIIAESIDRLGRGGSGTWSIFEDCQLLGVAIVTAEEGEIDEEKVGMKTTFSASFLKGLKAKTRRGLAGVAREGRHAGGRVYGYRRLRRLDAKGEVIRGELETLPAEADAVRQIFEAYAAGASPRAIAARLNAQGVPGPRGGAWNASTINGNAARGNGVLHNELYRGWLVWGRQTWVKDRRTGKRRSRLGQAANVELVRTEVPALRIVSEDLWARVQARYAEVSHGPNPLRGTQRPRRLLAGLVRCGSCGGGMIIAGKPGYFLCSARRERGPTACANGRSAPAAKVEARIVTAVREGLLHPAVIERSIEAYRQRADADRLASLKRQAEIERRLAEAKRRAARLVDQLADGLALGATIAERLAELEAERAGLERELAAIAAAAKGQVTTIAPRAAGEYRKIVERMQAALEGPEGLERDAARDEFRRLVREVIITPGEKSGEFALSFAGDLADLLRLNAKVPRPEPGDLLHGWVRGRAAAGEASAPFRLTA